MPTIDELRTFLMYSLGASYAVLMVWFAAFTLAHDALHRFLSRWFRLSVETFDAVNYGGMAVYKIGVLLLFAAPWLALWCLG